MAFHLVGVDLGGTKIATALTDTRSEILRYETLQTDPSRGPEAIVAEMVETIRRVTAGVRPESILGVGVACAGLIERVSGRVLFSPNLAWENLPLGAMLRAALPWEIYVANDVSMAALGEHELGAARGKQDVVAIFVGTGIGAGLIIDGRLYLGASGFAGEVGQMTVQWDGPACPGGNRGCLESFASGAAMQRLAREAIARGRPSLLTDRPEAAETLTVEHIAAAAEAGDALAKEIVDEAIAILGAGVANVINLLNPEMLVLGGGVVRGIPDLVERVREAARSRLMPGFAGHCEVVAAQFGREAGVIGATVFVKHAGRVDPSRAPAS